MAWEASLKSPRMSGSLSIKSGWSRGEHDCWSGECAMTAPSCDPSLQLHFNLSARAIDFCSDSEDENSAWRTVILPLFFAKAIPSAPLHPVGPRGLENVAFRGYWSCLLHQGLVPWLSDWGLPYAFHVLYGDFWYFVDTFRGRWCVWTARTHQ